MSDSTAVLMGNARVSLLDRSAFSRGKIKDSVFFSWRENPRCVNTSFPLGMSSWSLRIKSGVLAVGRGL